MGGWVRHGAWVVQGVAGSVEGKINKAPPPSLIIIAYNYLLHLCNYWERYRLLNYDKQLHTFGQEYILLCKHCSKYMSVAVGLHKP